MTDASTTLLDLRARFHPHWLAVLLGMLTLVFGFGLGIAFGAAEDSMKQNLKDRAQAVLAEKYQGDTAKADAVVGKAWSYAKRAHLHAGGLGASALVLITLLALTTKPGLVTRSASHLLGLGALGYSVFWLVAGHLAPSLGGTGAAKDALEWLAMPSAGAIVIGTLLTLGLVTGALVRRPPAATA